MEKEKQYENDCKECIVLLNMHDDLIALKEHFYRKDGIKYIKRLHKVKMSLSE